VPDVKVRFPADLPQMLEKSKQEKLQYSRVWSFAIQMLRGRQWIWWDKSSKTIAQSPRTSGDPVIRLTINHMHPIFRQLVSALATVEPAVVALPSSNQTDDITKAMGVEFALRSWWLTDCISEKLEKANRWCLQTGTGVLRVLYIPDREMTNRVLEVDPDDDLSGGVLEPEVKRFSSEKEQGRVTLRAENPFNTFTEAGIKDVNESRWVGFRSYTTRGVLMDTYPKKKKEIETLVSFDTKERQVHEDMAPTDRIEIFEVYWRDGRYAVSAGGIYLFKTYKDEFRKAFPVAFYRFCDIEDVLWPPGPMELIATPQELYNRTRTLQHQVVRLMSAPVWLIPRSADVPKTQDMNKVGAKVYYNTGGGKPEPSSPPMVSPQALREPVQLLQEMYDIAGTHAASMGKGDSGVRSGVQQRSLTTQDAAAMMPTMASLYSAVQVVVKAALVLMKAHYTEDRYMRAHDSLGHPIWAAISSARLSDDPEVHIDATSLFRVDAEARDQRILSVAQMFPDALPPDQVLSELSFRTGDRYRSDKFAALSHAHDLLSAVKDGHEIEIFATDDLAAFELVFKEYIQSQDYYDLSDDEQERFRDIYVAITMANRTPQEIQAGDEADRVYPASPVSPVLQSPTLNPQGALDQAATEQGMGPGSLGGNIAGSGANVTGAMVGL